MNVYCVSLYTQMKSQMPHCCWKAFMLSYLYVICIANKCISSGTDNIWFIFIFYMCLCKTSQDISVVLHSEMFKQNLLSFNAFDWNTHTHMRTHSYMPSACMHLHLHFCLEVRAFSRLHRLRIWRSFFFEGAATRLLDSGRS